MTGRHIRRAVCCRERRDNVIRGQSIDVEQRPKFTLFIFFLSNDFDTSIFNYAFSN